MQVAVSVKAVCYLFPWWHALYIAANRRLFEIHRWKIVGHVCFTDNLRQYYSKLICGNKMPTRCNRCFYCTSYCLLIMFRAQLCPSSGAQEYYTVVAACGISCYGFQVAGLVWSWGLCVRFAGCCSILQFYNSFKCRSMYIYKIIRSYLYTVHSIMGIATYLWN